MDAAYSHMGSSRPLGRYTPGGSPPEAKRRVSDADGGGHGSEVEGGRSKKQKFTRSRTACLQCRARKSKCGALPPHPCPNCIEANLPCQWPAEDGRSSRARLQRQKNRPSDGSMDGSAPGRIDGAGPDTGTEWLDQLLAAGQMQASSGQTIPTPGSLASSGGGGGAGGRSMLPPGTAYHPASFTPFPDLTPQPPSATPLPALHGPASSTAGPAPSAPYYRQMPPSSSYAGLPAAGSSSSNFIPATPANLFDPAQFIWAVTSRLPTVEESSPADRSSVSGSGPSPTVGDATRGASKRQAAGHNGRKKTDEGKIVKISWWRPHGPTALTPGLKRITLKVRLDSPSDPYFQSANSLTPNRPSPAGAVQQGATPQEVIGEDGLPSTEIMRHLLDVFMVHFGCQFPFVDKGKMEARIEQKTGSVFLLFAIAGIAARFSNHPAIALPGLEPWASGNVFVNRAKALLGSMLAVPSRDTVIAFVLLAHTGFANDSESEVWMMTGLAVRMSIDAGFHINPPEDSRISPEDRRLNRLVFWSVLLMDYALAFGVGRQTAFRTDDITQTLPTEEDIHPESSSTSSTERSPFPYAAKQMVAYGPVINLLNSGKVWRPGGEAEFKAARAEAIRVYNQLPADMLWNVGNLQRHTRVNQGSIFLHVHLWMHTIIASGYLMGTSLLRHPPATPKPASASGLSANGARSGAATPNTMTASSLWRNSVRTIGDVLVLSDIINPHAYLALPFVNQAFYVAGCCYVKEIEQSRSNPPSPASSPRKLPLGLTMTPAQPPTAPDSSIPASANNVHSIVVSSPSPAPSSPSAKPTKTSPPPSSANTAQVQAEHSKDPRQVDLSRALLTSVATSNISTLKQGLDKQGTYWSGIAWITGALAQRIEGIQDVDLKQVTEDLESFVRVPDVGLVQGGKIGGKRRGGRAGEEDGVNGGGEEDGADGGDGAEGQAVEHSGMGTGLTPIFAGTGESASGWTPLAAQYGLSNGNGNGAMGDGISGSYDYNDLSFLSLPFDLGSSESGGQTVTEQEVPLPQAFNAEWFR